ncbi:MAG: metallophosphoesterase [Flammeovirgaceae bacterium]
MIATKSNQNYYFISDLHIGGDGILDECQFESELIDFLYYLKDLNQEAELIIVGDGFGFWEMSGEDSLRKLKTVIKNHPDLFTAFRESGAKIKITLIPGNHDHEMIGYQEFKMLLAKYNINLINKQHIIRKILTKKIWIEHGSQNDPFNKVEDFNNPKSTPLGFFSTKTIVDLVHRKKPTNKQLWIRDLESVYPNEYVPHWFFSNYIYHEMSPILRSVILPYIILFLISLVIIFGSFLEQRGILATKFFIQEPWQKFGLAGRAFDFAVFINTILFWAIVTMSIPIWVIFRDFRKVLKDYGFQPGKMFKIQKAENYLQAVKEVFDKDNSILAFIYGHTHEVSITKIDQKFVINTGTWLKKLIRINSIFPFLPDVYYPTFQLNYFHIYPKGSKKIVIDYHIIPKNIQPNLTILQNLAIMGRRKKLHLWVPKRTEVEMV